MRWKKADWYEMRPKQHVAVRMPPAVRWREENPLSADYLWLQLIVNSTILMFNVGKEWI